MRALIPFDLVLESRALNPVGGVECAGCSRGGTFCIRDHSDLLDVVTFALCHTAGQRLSRHVFWLKRGKRFVGPIVGWCR